MIDRRFRSTYDLSLTINRPIHRSTPFLNRTATIAMM